MSDNPSIIPYQDKREQLNSTLQLAWTENIRTGSNTLPLYEKVAVLLISWDCDDLDTDDEVKQLSDVFNVVFNYKVSSVYLSTRVKNLPQVQLFKHIADFVALEDGPATLLIVYYAGHGTPSGIPGRLELSSTRGPTIDNMEPVVWNLAEASLECTRADVFEIFDCCYAGDLGRGPRFSTRQFEFLGATSAGSTTKGPGKHSFTSGLIWALKKLADNHERFTTSQLTRTIRECPDFPNRQVPSLSERNVASVERIVLAPLPKYEDLRERCGKESDNVSQNPELLDLKFILDKCPTKGEIEELAKGVNMMIQTKNFVVHRVIWGGLYPWPGPNARVDLNHPIVREAAKRFKQLALSRQREQSRNRQTSIYLQPPSPMSSHGPDPSEPVTPITPLDTSTPMSHSKALDHGGVAHETDIIQTFPWLQTFTYLCTDLITREVFLLAGLWVIILLTNES